MSQSEGLVWKALSPLAGGGAEPCRNLACCAPRREGGAGSPGGCRVGLPHGGQRIGGGAGGRVGRIGLSLLGLLAKIKCSICSYQLNI